MLKSSLTGKRDVLKSTNICFRFFRPQDFASIIHNLAGLRNHHLANGTHESVSLLEQHSPQIVPTRAARPTSLGGSGQGLRRGPASWIQSSPMVPSSGVAGTGAGAGPGGGGVGGTGGNGESSPHTGSLTGPVPRKRRFEAFLKNLVGRRPSKEPPPAAPPPPPPPLLSSPEIKISKSPSEHNLADIARSRLNISTTSLSSETHNVCLFRNNTCLVVINLFLKFIYVFNRFVD